MAAQHSCNLDDITTCPSAQIIKSLLKRLNKWNTAAQSLDDPQSDQKQQSVSVSLATVHSNEFQAIQSLISIFQHHNYSVTELLNDLQHLKYDHGIDGDDDKFDVAYEFFNDSTTTMQCDVNQCGLVQRYYRDRGQQPVMDRSVADGDTLSDEVLMDIMAMVHCYFVHSFDINRLTKAERENVEMALSLGVGLEDEKQEDTESDDMRRIMLVADILRAKEEKLRIGRGNRRFDGKEYVETASEKFVDFSSMAQAVGVDEVVLKEGLTEYGKDRNKLIGDLIDVVYGEDVEEMPIWKTLKVDDDRKGDIFRQILYDHFKCIQLSVANMVKICSVIVQRMEFQIDIDAMNEVMTDNEIDGRIYDKNNPETHQSVNDFAQKFKSVPNCNGQNVRRMYNVVRKWKFIKMKKKKVEKPDETVDDGKEDEKEPVGDDDVIQIALDQRPEIYEIGKQFYFWDLLKGHRRFIKAKYENMKEEVMHSPLLDGLVSMSAWNKLTKDIAVIIATECALRITSNGLSYSMYGIQQYEPLDAEHLRSLKLYTDFSKFCSKFCTVLRWGNPIQIAEMANFTRTLIETVQCYGTPLSPNKTYYRGVNRSFVFKTVATRFNLPLSTTISVKVFQG